MEASVGITHLPTRWSVKPSARILLAYSPLGRRRAGKDLSHMPVSCQVDPHISADATNDPALMAIRCLGAGHPGAISPGCRRVSVSLCRHQQIHQVARSDSCGQDQ
jgi:hypothetical protein